MTVNVKTKYTKTGSKKQRTAGSNAPSGPSVARGRRKYYTGKQPIQKSGLTDEQRSKIPTFWQHHWGHLKDWQRKNIVNAAVDGKSSKDIDKAAVRRSGSSKSARQQFLEKNFGDQQKGKKKKKIRSFKPKKPVTGMLESQGY